MSAAFSIRSIREEELSAYVDALSTGFLDRPDPAAIAAEVRPLWDLSRAWAAFEEDAIRGTFRSWASELTVPGGAALPASAIAAVTVRPTHRRRGILSAMVATEHAAARDRGEVLGILHASEWPIYGRFGYGPATLEATWTLDATATSFRGGPVEGVELVTPDAALRDEMIALYETRRRADVGELRRRAFSWDFDLGLRPSVWGDAWKGFLAIHRDATGRLDGYVRYSPDGTWERRQPRVVARVDELHTSTDDAYRNLWRYLAEIDWVATVRAGRRRLTERLPWLLTNARAASLGESGDDLWVRLLDIRRALESRIYETEGRIVMEVMDAEAPGGRMRLALDAGPGGATCRATDASPDLTVGVSALGAAYLGGTRLRDAVLASGADEHTTRALALADRLLHTLDEPWCSTFF